MTVLNSNNIVNSFLPENDYGNIEYKLKLTNISNDRNEELITQMKFRLNEGNGEAIYQIGILDNGTILGINETDMRESIDNLIKIANSCQAGTTIISKNKIKDSYITEILVREINYLGHYIDIKIAVAGNVDAGKSTLIGVLTGGKLDNGRGMSRLNVFNHKHEIDSGRTSSIGHQITGYDVNGNIVNKNNIKMLSWPEIIKSSSKVISFYDLAGHEKYLRTTIGGFSSIHPDYSFILIGANMGITHITKEHLYLSLYYNIPFIIIITKIDIAPENVLNETMNKIKKILKLPGIRKIPYSIKNNDDIINASKNMKSNNIVPIFQISNVSGTGISHLEQFINLLPSRVIYNKDDTNLVEFTIDDTFQVSGCGTIVCGLLLSGKIKINDNLFIGPDQGDDSFKPIQVRSIHFKRLPIESIDAGHYICLCLKKFPRKNIKKGMVIVSSKSQTQIYRTFKANIHILKSHHTTIRKNYQPVLHINHIRQSAQIIDIHQDTDILRTGDKALVTFKFMFRPVYIKKGYRLIFREGKIRGIGEVVELID